MKVGVLTYHHSLNCGAALQAWALQTHLRKCGHDASISVSEAAVNSNVFLSYTEAAAVDPVLLEFAVHGAAADADRVAGFGDVPAVLLQRPCNEQAAVCSFGKCRIVIRQGRSGV